MSQTCRQELDLGSEGLSPWSVLELAGGEGVQRIPRQLLKVC